MEIATRIFTLENLKKVSLEPYDGVYLGDSFAPKYAGNLCFSLKDLKEAVFNLKEKGKRVYISTFSVPRNRDLPPVEEQLRFIASEKLPLDALEAHNTGVMSMAGDILPGVPIHMGCLANIYTDSTVNLLKESGVTRVSPNYELSLEEVEIIKNQCQIQVEPLVHGKMILGVSEECPAVWWNSDKEKADDLCSRVIELSSERMNLTVRGRVTMSGKDVCMLEHIPLLIKKGFDCFRLNTLAENPAYFEAAGKAYREAIDMCMENKKSEEYSRFAKEAVNRLASFSPNGFCNGYYFKVSGSSYLSPPEVAEAESLS